MGDLKRTITQVRNGWVNRVSCKRTEASACSYSSGCTVRTSTSRPALHVAGCLLMLMSACSRTGNYDRAYFSVYGGRYFVEMKGTRRLMAHDPFSAIRGRTYEDTLMIELPRIEGVIKGSEIPVPPDKLRYVGEIVITKNKMKVDLYYDDRSDSKVPLPWNDEYTLVQKDAGLTP